MTDHPEFNEYDYPDWVSVAVSSDGLNQTSIPATNGAEVTSHPQPELDVDFEDLAPLEYARASGLTRNHVTEEYAEVDAIQDDVYPGCLADSHLPQFDLGTGFKVEERVSVSKEGAALLASVAHEEVAESIDALILPMLGARSSTCKAKLELPLLRSDHETDCKNFGRREGFEIKLQDVRLPLESVDEENGQGLGLPSRFWNIGPKLLEQLKGEKIGISKDTIAYLQDALKAAWTAEDEENLWNSEIKYKRNHALAPVTPPLSPLRAEPEPYEPSSDDSAFQVPILSDPESPTKRELADIEARLFKQDAPSPFKGKGELNSSAASSSETYAEDEVTKLGDIYSPLASLDNSDPPPFVEPQRLRREDLSVEAPLTPSGPAISPPKAVRFSEIIEELQLDEPQSRINSPTFEDKFFEEAFAASAEIANRRAEQEKLIEADATARVDVPVMDFSKPEPPWKKFENQKTASSLLSLQRSFIRDSIGQGLPKWPGSKQSLLKLKWVPFDKNLAKVALEEHLDGDEDALTAFLNNPSDREVIDSSSLTWKRPGLMILHEDEDDDEEIKPGRFRKDEPQDLSFLVRKRKSELQERAALHDDASSSKLHQLSAANAVPVKKIYLQTAPKSNDFISAAQKMRNDPSRDEDFGNLLGGTFSAQNSLDNYLELRGNKKKKLADSTYFGAKMDKPQSNQASLTGKAQEQAQIQLPIRKSPLAKATPLPTPTIPQQAAGINVIVASTLLKHRALIKHLETQLPSLTLVERDFTAHNTSAWMPGSVTRSPIVSPLASEADLIISASTGVIITTLQKIKQKLLPGQKGKTAIRDRIEKVALRYERLIILVSEGNSEEHTSGMGESECLAFSDFMGFVMGLDTSITVQFVGGGEETLSKWLANAIVYNRVAGELELLPDETHWELFLRRAGLNAFAAQVIISQLKAPEGVDTASPTKAGQFGLTAFVEMAREQRIALLGKFCGRKLLERVSAVVDGMWE